MKGFYKSVLVAALVAIIASGMIAPSSHADLTVWGKFRLPFDAQFDKMALPTGDYWFRVDGLSFRGRIVIFRGNQPLGTLHPDVFNDRERQSKNPVFVCIRHDGNVTVRALRLPNVGTFYFPLPTGLKTLVAQEPQLIETVSIEANGN